MMNTTDNTQTLQTAFQEFILGQRDAASMHVHLAVTPGLSRDARLDIYYQAYRLRLRDALSEAYGKTHSYLGDDLFYQACAVYIDSHPSSYRNLRWFGDQFPALLQQQFAEHPQVAELAQFEWALGCAFDACDHAILKLADLGTVSNWETVGLSPSSSLQFIDMHWNGVAIWLALNEDKSPPEPVYTNEVVTWMVWRKQLQAHFRSLVTEEAEALRQLGQGQRFAEVCERAAEDNPQIENDIGGWLHTWVVDEMLAEIVE